MEREGRSEDAPGDELVEGQARAAVAPREGQEGHDELDAVDAAERRLAPEVLRVERRGVVAVLELAEEVLRVRVGRALALRVDDGRAHRDAAEGPAVPPRVDDIVVDDDRVREAVAQAPRDLAADERHAEPRRGGVLPQALARRPDLDDDLVELAWRAAAAKFREHVGRGVRPSTVQCLPFDGSGDRHFGGARPSLSRPRATRPTARKGESSRRYARDL